jgi:Zn-dependent M28 family amino/carboxypeptidase
MELDYKYNDLADPNHFYERSDHYNFAKHGVPSVLYLMVFMPITIKNRYSDKIEYDALAKRAQLAFTMAWELAEKTDLL